MEGRSCGLEFPTAQLSANLLRACSKEKSHNWLNIEDTYQCRQVTSLIAGALS